MVKITDNADANNGFIYKNAAGNNYDYDDNGNLIRDDNKYITNIKYNYLNLPVEISFWNGYASVKFTYDANGTKLMKSLFVNGTNTTNRYYVNGIEYTGASITGTDAVPDMIQNAEGYSKRNTSGNYDDNYVLRDHLGNTRLVFQDKNGDGVIDKTTEIVQVNAYYPFGMNHGANVNGANGAFKYQYNGKELNDDYGLNWNDYGARFYDPSLGRWNVIDPMLEMYTPFSPYGYVRNNPMGLIDPDGMRDSTSQPIPLPVVVVTDKRPDNYVEKALGLIQTVAGAVEIAGGAALMATPGGQVFGVLLIANGVDNAQAGIRQTLSGKHTNTLYHGALEAGAEAVGFDEDDADKVATGGEFITNLALGGGAVYKSLKVLKPSAAALPEVVGASTQVAKNSSTVGVKAITKGLAKTSTQAVEGIYEFTAASGKTYVGQAGNIAARLEQHIASGKLLPGTLVRTTQVLGGKTAREIAEQLRINSLGGIYQDGFKVLENMRNPIGPARQYLLPKIP